MTAGQIYGSKFSVSHRNGKPLKGRYFVLNLDSKNEVERERSRKAMQVYIQEAVATDCTYALELLKFYTDASVQEKPDNLPGTAATPPAK